MKTLNRALCYFLNLKLKTKLLLIYLFTYCISLILLFLVLKAAVGRQFFEHEKSLLDSSLTQGVSRVESQISDAINLSNVIYNNDDILSACNIDYGHDYFRMYLAYHDDVLPDFYTYKCLLPDVSNIKIYTSCGLIPYKNTIDDISLLDEIPWFDKQASGHDLQWGMIESDEGSKLVCIRRLPHNSSYPFQNCFYFEIDSKIPFASLTAVSRENYGLVVTGTDGSVLFEYHSPFPEGAVDEQPPVTEPFIDGNKLADSYPSISRSMEDQYLFLSTTVESTGWTVYYYSPISEIKATVDKTILSTFFIISFSFALLFMLIFFIINTILAPLAELTKTIEKISLENIGRNELQIVPGRKDEVGTLIHTFNTMLERIHILIDEAYVQKLHAKEYQLKALRAQINPHFLYNTLSLISARAIVAGQDDISETVRLLTMFYRTSLNHGHDLTSIQNELDNIRAYLSIQLALKDHSFSVLYELDENLLNVSIPCLILQPLVENAIEHGLMDSRKPSKELRISLYQEEDSCYISICDNGLGISEDKIKNLFTCESDHIGVKNVYERLKLSYGEGNGLTIKSKVNVGTQALILIPLTSPPNDNHNQNSQ